MLVNINDIKETVFNEYFNYENVNKIIDNWDKIIEELLTSRKNKILKQEKGYDPLIPKKKIVKSININRVSYEP